MTQRRSTRGPETAFRLSDWPMPVMAAIRYQNITNLSHVLRPFGLSPQGWRVLANLAASDGNNIGYLAAVTMVERSNLSRLVEAMERDGLVRRVNQGADKRQRLVYLTDAGRKRYEETLPAIQGLFAHTYDGISAKEMADLMRILRRIRDNACRWPTEARDVNEGKRTEG